MATSTGFGVRLVTRFLEQAGVQHDVVEHPPTYGATDEAAAAHADERYTAKSLVLRDRGEWLVAVLPADRRLDLDKARRLLGAGRHLRLATEEEIAERFPDFDVGAMPPVLPLPEVIDVQLLF